MRLTSNKTGLRTGQTLNSDMMSRVYPDFLCLPINESEQMERMALGFSHRVCGQRARSSYARKGASQSTQQRDDRISARAFSKSTALAKAERTHFIEQSGAWGC